MKWFILMLLGFVILSTGCTKIVPITIPSTEQNILSGGSGNVNYYYYNITDNITNNITYNITYNITNNLTYNTTYNITNNFSNSIKTYRSTFINNTWKSLPITTTAISTIVVTSNSVRAYPITFEGEVIDSIIIRKTAGIGITTQNCTFGVYNSTYNITIGVKPDKLILNLTNINLNSTGTTSHTSLFINNPILMRNNTYWFAYICQGTPTLSGIVVAEQLNTLGMDKSFIMINMLAYAKTYNSSLQYPLDQTFNNTGITYLGNTAVIYGGFGIRTDKSGTVIG